MQKHLRDLQCNRSPPLESTVRDLGIKVDDELEVAEQRRFIELQASMGSADGMAGVEHAELDFGRRPSAIAR